MEEKTRKEKVREEQSKLKDLSLPKKLEYIWDYYKPHMAGVLVIVALIGMLVQIIHNKQMVTELSAALINAQAETGAVTQLHDEFVEFADLDGDKQEVILDDGYQIRPESMDQMTMAGETKIMAAVSASSLDVMLMDQEAFDFYVKTDMFLDLRGLFPEEEYGNLPVEMLLLQEAGTGEAWGMDVSKSRKLAGIYTETPVILGVPSNANNTKNIQKFVQYLLS